MTLLAKLLLLVPRGALDALGAALGSLVWTLRIRRGVVLGNLRLAFPEKTEAERRAIARATYRSLGRMVFEFLRVPGLDFKARMAGRPLWVVSTSGDRAKAQPMFDSLALCAQFMGMQAMPPLWGKGGPPDAVQQDTAALAAAEHHFIRHFAPAVAT